MDEVALRRLISGGETAHVEFKVATPRVSDLATRICGFANGEGGDLILGVADKTWAIVGVTDPAAATDALLQASRQCKPPVTFAPPRPALAPLAGKDLVVAHIPPNDGLLHQAAGVFYIRRGTFTVPLDASEIERFLHAKGTLAWEEHAVLLASLDDLDAQRVRDYLTHRPGRRTGAMDADPATLQRLGCASPNPGDSTTMHPTRAGLLLFGKAPQDFLLHAELVCVLFGDELGLRRYLDRRILHGALPEQIDQAEEFLKRHMRVGARTEGFHRVDVPDYPLEALREAVVNALVHRDYSLAGEAARLFFYPDRVEVHSPGLLLPGIRLEDLRAGRVPSRPRNPIMANLLRDIPGGYMERLGSGIAFMLREMRELGRPAPEFQEQNEFVVTFRLAAPLPLAIDHAPVEAGNLEAQQHSGAGRPRMLNATARQAVALRYVQEHGAISNKIYRHLTGVSDMTALRDLDALLQQGLLYAVGQGRGRVYKR